MALGDREIGAVGLGPRLIELWLLSGL